METLYIIQLKQNKWYVGKTKNFNHRMDQHVDGDGAQWTNKYGPQLACTKVGEFMDATWEETKKTLELMLDKGLNNVRGAEYCQLDDFTINDIKRMSYACLHHLKRDSRINIENIFKNSLLKTSDINISDTENNQRKKACYSGNSVKTNINEDYSNNNIPMSSNLPLHQIIRQIRDNEALKEGYTNTYMIFPNQTLDEMASKIPTTIVEFSSLFGVGSQKLDKYGPVFLKAINKYVGNQACDNCGNKIFINPSKPLCFNCYKLKINNYNTKF